MSTWTIYLLGLATLPAAFLVVAVIHAVYIGFTAHSVGYGCATCFRRFGLNGTGAPDAIAWAQAYWHHTVAHPGHRGRHLVCTWRGWEPRDWMRYQRLNRAFPEPPLTAWDVLARIPIIGRVAFRIARRHRRSTPWEVAE